MKEKLSLIGGIAMILFFLNMEKIYAQNNAKTKQIIHSLEPSKTGLTRVFVDFTYEFENVYGDIELRFATRCRGNKEFQHKGKVYLPGSQDGIDNVRPFDPVIEVTIQGYGAYVVTKSYQSIENLEGGMNTLVNSFNVFPNAKTPEEKNPANYRIIDIKVKSIGFENCTPVIASIEENIRKEDIQKKIASLAAQAEMAYKKGDYSGAVKLYEELIRLDPENTVTESKLNNIKEKIEQEKERIKNEKNISSPEKSYNSGKNNNSGNSVPTNSNQKKSNIVNGIDRSKLPEYARETTTGKYYKKDSDNNYHEISYDEYFQAKTNESKEKQEAALAKKQQEDNAIINKSKRDLQASTDKYWADVAERQRKSEISYQNNMASFYAAKAADEAKGQIRDNSKLSGNYANADEIRADYRQKYQALTQGYDALQEANTQKNQANLNIYNENTDENGKVLGQFATDVSNYVGQLEAEAAERRAKKALREQREAAEANLIKLEKANRLELRKKLFSQFPDGGLPLSSHPVDTNELYFFSYVFNTNTINDDYTTITLSNVFPIAKYNDGTWLFKNRLISELTKSVTGSPITLMGYYTTRQMAEEMRNTFIELAKSSKMGIKDFLYMGKPATSESKTNVDYWGNGTNENSKQNTSETNVNNSSPQSEKIDFWGNPINSETKKTPANKPASKPSQTNTKTDFWGNPIK